jgi:hypothetical protein
MTDARARIGETTATTTISSKAVSKGEVAGNEEPKESGGGTGSG